ncbi:hypothetical protein [Desulfobacter sp.]|uniref:hypothetical protein n=1 Tax=Desulfobacter sp. TaxID=2294 RepID=UPI003D0BFE11
MWSTRADYGRKWTAGKSGISKRTGIRGSGKSSVLEIIRYVLGIPFGEKAGDTGYKQNLVGFSMGSGGKVEIDAMDRYGQLYTICRVWKESFSDVLIEGKLQPGVSILETVLHKPIYFGQKDLSNSGEGFGKDLVDKLLGARLDRVRRDIGQQKQNVIDAVDRLTQLTNVKDQIEEQRKIKLDTEHRLKFYADHGVEEKFQKRLDFDNDVRMLNKGIKLVENFVSDLESLLAQHEDDVRNFKGYQSKHNASLFGRFYAHYQAYIALIDQIKAWLDRQETEKQALVACKADLGAIRKGMVEEFAEIERKLGQELKSSGTQNISSDEFAYQLLPYRGFGSGVLRALENYPDINFIDDRDGNLFKCIIRRRDAKQLI